MSKRPLQDIVVVIPGITGSALQRGGKDIWNLSGRAAWRGLRTGGGSLRDLALTKGEDEIVATKLIAGPHLVAGLTRVDGYAAIVEAIASAFDVRRAWPGDWRPANLIEFPYDWRRDNREAARALGSLLECRLHAWREHSGANDARAIVIGHSMGGLLARYWIECLGGRRDCRALITLGTPHRGSLDAVNYLANGYKKLFLDLTDAMRSFPSVHQLLPIYGALRTGEETRRVAETDGLPGIDAKLARDGLAFHREIEAANKRNEASGTERYALLPFVGTHQPTMQSAVLENGRVRVSEDLPPGIDALLGDGDGTVPRASAIPIEMSNAYRDTFTPERHGSLQANQRILDDLIERIAQLQVRGLDEVRSAEVAPSEATRPALALDLDAAYLADEPVRMRVRLVNSSVPLGVPQARIEPLDPPSAIPPRDVSFADAQDGWLELDDLAPGLYRALVSTDGGGQWAPSAVHDLFEVLPAEAGA